MSKFLDMTNPYPRRGLALGMMRDGKMLWRGSVNISPTETLYVGDWHEDELDANAEADAKVARLKGG